MEDIPIDPDDRPAEPRKEPAPPKPRGRWRRRLLWASGIGALGVAGLALGLQPLLTSALRKSLPKIQEAATAALGAEVTFKSIDVHVSWLMPEVEIVEAKVLDPETKGPALTLERAVVQLDLQESWRRRSLRFGHVLLQRPRALLKERVPGEWIIEGLRLKGAEGGARPEWVSPEVTLQVVEAELRVKPWVDPPSLLKLPEGKAELRALEERGSWSLDLELSGLRAPEAHGVWVSAQADEAAGKFKIGPEGWTLSGIRARIGAIRLEGSVSRTGKEEPLKVELAFEGGTFRDWLLRVPKSLLTDDLSRWLETALRGGAVQSGKFRLWGVPSRWKGLEKFDGKSDGLDVSMSFKDLELDYREGWPRITKGDGQLKLLHRKLEVEFDTAEGEGILLQELHGGLADLSAAAPALEVAGKVESTPEATLSFLRTGPFKEQAEPLLTYLTPSGPSRFGMSLKIPLAGEEAVTGSFDFEDTKIRQPALEADVEGVSGKLSLLPAAFEFSEFAGQFLGKPLRFEGRYGREKDGVGDFKVAATVPVGKLAAFAPAGVDWAAVFSGELAAESDIRVQGNRFLGRWRSDLKGLGILAPEPFGKAADQPLALSWEADWDSSGLKRLLVRWPSPELKVLLDPAKRLAVDGKFGRAPIEEWMDFLAKVSKPVETAAGTEKSGGVALPPNWSVDLWGEELVWREHRFPGAKISFKRDGDIFQGAIDSIDLRGKLEGKLPLPANLLRIDLERLKLSTYPWRSNETVEGTPDEDPPGWDLSTWPSLSLRVRSFRMAEQDLGAFSAEIRQTGEGLVSDHFLLAGPELELKLTRFESRTGAGPFTNVEGDFRAKKTLFPVRMKKLKGVELEEAKFSFKGGWPGAPNRFALKRLDGQFQGTIRAGAFHGIESAAANVFNFLSFAQDDSRQKIARFYKASLDIKAADGILKFNPFRALFGSVYMRLTGDAKAADRTYAMEARVTPMVEDLPAGAEEPGNLLSHTYRITGPWKDPSVKLKIF